MLQPFQQGDHADHEADGKHVDGNAGRDVAGRVGEVERFFESGQHQVSYNFV